MKGFLELILFWFVLFFIVYLLNCEDIGSGKEAKIKYKNYVVIDKDSYLLNFMSFEKDSNIVRVRCSDIFYKKYNVGDTIK